MGISYALGNVFLAPQYYKNWPEVLIATAKKQEPSKVILKNGLQFEAGADLKFLVRDIYIGKPYTPFFPVGENDIVVDIGANIGVFTVFAASRTHNAVHAFEPAPGNFEFVKRNIRSNGLTNVVAHNAAVSDTVGSAKLFLNPTSNSGHVLLDPVMPDKHEKHLLFDPGRDKMKNYIEIPTTTLPEIMDSNNLEQIDFLKLDCEGSEGVILRETPKAYLKRVKKIAMEFHDQLSQLNHDELQKLLEEAGFITRLKWEHESPFGYLYAWRD